MEQPDPGHISDSGLLDACRKGDNHAFRMLVGRFRQRLMATAVGMVGPGQDAEEIVQEAFVRFHRSMHRFEGRSSLGTYLTRITMNEALKVIRKRKPWRYHLLSRDDPDSPLDETADLLTVGHSLEQSERAGQIRDAVQSLKPEFRNVVVLRFLNEYSTAECADILEIPQGTVMSRLSRALEKLGPILQSVYEHE